MRTIVTDGQGGLQAAERPVPEPPVGGALVRVLACGLCGSDLEKLGGPHAVPGKVLGHEVVGVLERPGMEPSRVALAHHVPCGACRACRSGHSSLCAQFASTQLDPGGFAERLAVTPLHLQDAVFTLPDTVDDLTGTLLEPLSCVLRAFDAVGGVRGAFPLTGVAGHPPEPRDGRPLRFLVAGCGSMGLLFLAALTRDAAALRADEGPGGVARSGEPAVPVAAAPQTPPSAGVAAGAVPSSTPPVADVFFVERDVERGALAAGLGARPLAEAAGDGVPMDVAVVTAPAALPETVAAMAPGGIVLVFAAREAPAGLDLDTVYRRELTLLGVRSGSPDHLRRALAVLIEGSLPLDWFRPDVVSLEDLPAAAARYARGETLKVVARP